MAPARARGRERRACARHPRATRRPGARAPRGRRARAAPRPALACSARPFPCMRRPNAMLAATSRWGRGRRPGTSARSRAGAAGRRRGRGRRASPTLRRVAAARRSPAAASTCRLHSGRGRRPSRLASTARSTPASASWPPSTTLRTGDLQRGCHQSARPRPSAARSASKAAHAAIAARTTAKRRSDALVRLAGAAEEAEDRHGQRRLLGPGDEDGGAELAERDREREPGRDGERPADERQVDLAPAPQRRRAERRRHLAQAPGRSTGARA